MTDFTNLEVSVLRMICSQQPALDPYLDAAKVTARDNTGHGFYTHFRTNPSLPPLTWPNGMVDGPNLQIGAGSGAVLMGFVLWLEAGWPGCLEGFQYDTEDGEIDLKTYDLSTMTILGEWS